MARATLEAADPLPTTAKGKRQRIARDVGTEADPLLQPAAHRPADKGGKRKRRASGIRREAGHQPQPADLQVLLADLGMVMKGKRQRRAVSPMLTSCQA